ncbi:MAG: hypothetical protein ACFWTL_12330 [Atopobium sp.]|jgi:hypothetical protein
MGAPEVVRIDLRDVPVEDLAFFHEVGHHAGDNIRLGRRVDAVLVVEVDMVGARRFREPSTDSRMRTGEESITKG